jgi:hypothetical protein
MIFCVRETFGSRRQRFSVFRFCPNSTVVLIRCLALLYSLCLDVRFLFF